MRGSIRRVVGTSVLATAISACGALGTTGPRSELSENRERWEATRPLTYRYAVRPMCFCGFEENGPVWVTVTGDSVTDRSYVDSGNPVGALFEGMYPTVDGLFDVIADAIDRDAFELDVTYEATTGVPIDIRIDYIENAVDEELAYAVTELPGPAS